MDQAAVAAAGHVVGVDLGATSGRVVLGLVSPRELDVRTVARFANVPVRTPAGLHWDLLGLYAAALGGVAQALRQAPGSRSVAVDSWAVDYALRRGGRVRGLPRHYLDERSARGVRAVHAEIGPEELHARNGLQFLPFTTLYQLAAERLDGLLEMADGMLLVPDLVTYWLTGRRVAERTNASTTGLLSVRSGEWDLDLVRRLGIDPAILPPLVEAGTRVGPLLPEVAGNLGAGAALEVVATGSHDTASAVVAVPMQAEHAAYISCGTWGLVGVEVEAPVLSAGAREANFTNEGGVDGRVRFLHNVMGLWLLSESVRAWEREGGTAGLAELLAQAAEVSAPVAVFDTNDERFLPPGDMPARITDHCLEHDLPVPRSRAEHVRSIVESLAQAFADAVHRAAELSGTAVRTIHLVGGGALNDLLCQATADRAGLPVHAGPVEATAIGNVLVQARAVGLVTGDLETLRALVRSTQAVRVFQPSPA
ncbi:rhamnulokinase family protein [soil metagenome]